MSNAVNIQNAATALVDVVTMIHAIKSEHAKLRALLAEVEAQHDAKTKEYLEALDAVHRTTTEPLPATSPTTAN